MTDDRNAPVRSDSSPPVVPDDNSVWADLRRFTAARIGLKCTGASLATAPMLALRLAHSRARDALHEALDGERLIADLTGLGLPVLEGATAVSDCQTYLMRPDFGRRLAPETEAHLRARTGTYDLVFVVTEGLSAGAVQRHAAPVLAGVLPGLRAEGWRIAPLVLVRHGRVAVGDAVATSLGAMCVAILIGERPGLTAPESMGAYLTWQPGMHTTDADRNCISNIRPEGVGYADAAAKLTDRLRAMRARRLSGVRVKDDSDRAQIGDA